MISEFPASITTLEKCQPVYEEMTGWMTPIGDIRKFEHLPREARRYLNRLEELCGCPIKIISVGAKREQTIVRRLVL